ncbi:MAG: 37S ribosomal protein S24, mitochondrial [Pycnora praestabilis]|nr:MAG: 37S ribosomal protein S24, mitochondrial [Pycnora praestabilis]
MATSVNKLSITARRCLYQMLRPKISQKTTAPLRLFTSSSPLHKKDKDDDGVDIPERPSKSSRTPFVSLPPASFEDRLTKEDRALYDSLSHAEKEDFRSAGDAIDRYMTKPSVQGALNAAASNAAFNVEKEAPRVHRQLPRVDRDGYMAMGELDEQGTGNDDEFNEDDITALAHGELEQHREMREYARLAAWEMPLLSKLAKPFIPPTEDQPLRFRYTSYMGENHPAEKKVVLEFSPNDMLSLTETQKNKLIKLAGVRYNPSTSIIKMSSEMFETQAQNKRYLGDLVDTLLREAKDEAETFEDVPFDFRHHKPKPKLRFPDEWRMTPERQRQLEETRQQRQLLDQQRAEQGKLADGVRFIEAALRAPAVNTSKVMVEAQHGERGGAGARGAKKSRVHVRTR